MSVRGARGSRPTWIFTFLLPVLFLAPETVNLGVMFLRWDYLLLAAVFLRATVEATAMSRRSGARRLILPFPRLVLLYLIFTVFQVLALGPTTSLLDGLKYASWPLKILVWVLGVRLLYKQLGCGPHHVAALIRNLVFMVFGMQVLELLSPEFRAAVFKFYPVAATDRLIEITYRARGPFNGYDVTSLFLVVAAAFLYEIRREKAPDQSVGNSLALLACFAGAVISARTGLILFLAVTLYAVFLRRPSPLKVVAMLAVSFTALLLFGEYRIGYADDLGLIERYQELISAIQEGDLLLISSVSGTFHMNDALSFDERYWLWGTGLTTATTADQLYFKYFYMYGAVGLTTWVLVHCGLTLAAASGRNVEIARTYARAALVVSIVFALAHFKGGNYFFAARLGEIVALLFAFAEAKRSLSRALPTYDQATNNAY